MDTVEIFIKSGKGGDGFVHFHREKYVSRGGPDGGDGGRGGDVLLEVIGTMNTLSHFHQSKKFIAKEGGKGGINDMTGRSAEHLIIPVPPGTVVYDSKTGELLGDLTEIGQKLKVGRGGRGGRGNARFVTSRNQAPRIAEKGEPGQERVLNLELKLIADIGIIGMPNAGKSSLLAAITNANPKVADYPFTTLEPNLGVLYLDNEKTYVLADIPGLIEGAHKGIGLGDTFLRHVQRTCMLIHVLDGTSEDPFSDFTQINGEMALFDQELIEKPQIVIFNKIDLQEAADKYLEIKEKFEEQGFKILAISALNKQGLEHLFKEIPGSIIKTKEISREIELPVYRPKVSPNEFTIQKVNEGWQVRGAGLERAAAMTYWEHEGSVRRFQRLMSIIGVEEALRKAGAENGDTVFIGEEFELEWVE